MLHGRGVGTVAYFAQQDLARVTVLAAHADLDQIVRLEAGFDFLEYRGRQTFVAHCDHGFERVRARFEQLAFGWGKSSHNEYRCKNGL